jgi:hypothetical protein
MRSAAGEHALGILGATIVRISRIKVPCLDYVARRHGSASVCLSLAAWRLDDRCIMAQGNDLESAKKPEKSRLIDPRERAVAIATEQVAGRPAQGRRLGGPSGVDEGAAIVNESMPARERDIRGRSGPIEPCKALGPFVGYATIKFDDRRAFAKFGRGVMSRRGRHRQVSIRIAVPGLGANSAISANRWDFSPGPPANGTNGAIGFWRRF